MIKRASSGMVLQELAQLKRPTSCSTVPLTSGLPRRPFGLAFELRILDLDADDGHQTFAHILARQRRNAVLAAVEHVVLLGVVVEDACQGGSEARHVRSAVAGSDDIGE